MARQFFSDLPDTSTPLRASRLNGLLDGEEALGNLVVDSIRSKNIFNYKINSFEHAGTDVSLLDNGIKVTINDSNAAYPRANYFILDISNHLGKNITLTSTININSTAHPRIAIGTCDSTGENRNILSNTDTETNGRKSVTTTLPTSVTPNTQYMFIGFYCSHGTTVSSGNYVNFTDIQLEFGSSATTYFPYQNLNDFDSGWINMTLETNFHNYNPNDICQYRKKNGVVYLQGAASPTNQISANQETLLCTLPAGYRPTKEFFAICQGSGMNRWLLKIETDGKCYVARYGSSSNDAIPQNAWLPFSCLFVI